MKILKRIFAVCLALLLLSVAGGYFYFNKKLTPPDNYLNVSGRSATVPIKWVSSETNQHAAVLLPVKITGLSQLFYMQLDFGSPVTVFYSKPLMSLKAIYPGIVQLDSSNEIASLAFEVDALKISSSQFKVLDYGTEINFDSTLAENIIGTIGTDLLEKRIISLDFKNGNCSFFTDVHEDGFHDFEFKKRKILLPAKVGGKSLKLMYDSGTSGYQLIINKSLWEQYKNNETQYITEKGNSWGNRLTVITASADKQIQFGAARLNLTQVTYIEGTSKIQNLLMKRSGMQGMIGNKLFLNSRVILDCKKGKFKVE